MLCLLSFVSQPARLTQAAAALRRGDRDEARKLICAVLGEDARNLEAWAWAYEIASTAKERVHCLEQMLAIDPTHVAARRQLEQLRDDVPDDGEKRVPGGLRLLLTPLAWLLQVSPAAVAVGLLVVIMVGAFIYLRVNTDFFGLARPDFDALTISDSYEEIAADDMQWRVTFEKAETSESAGIVRHVSPIREGRLPILTHDVLVTSGEYADPDIVRVSVVNHRFTWHSSASARPKGRINLLHTVPADEEVYRQLLEIRSWDQVVIEGREILKIRVYDRDGELRGEWHDTGCNTLLVESVRIVDEETGD
jgi:hypothetical protein